MDRFLYIVFNENDAIFRRAPEDLDAQSQRLLDYQMQELEKYRLAVRTMGQDIIALRQQIRELEVNYLMSRHP